MDQPEARAANIETVQDTFKWLIFEPLKLSDTTRFDHSMQQLFGFSGQAGDAAISSCGADFAKLAVVALRRGKLPSGEQLISEDNWNKWAVPNLLPGGKLSGDLVGWEGASANWMNWDIANIKEMIMKQNGDYGWNYFGATYNDSKEIGWCGFFSSCLRVSYVDKISFVIMQRDFADLKKSKPYLMKNFASMAKALQCKDLSCSNTSGHLRFCEVNGKREFWSPTCPSQTYRIKNPFGRESDLDESNHACYVPGCPSSQESIRRTRSRFRGKEHLSSGYLSFRGLALAFSYVLPICMLGFQNQF